MEENKQPIVDSEEMDINADSDIPGNTHMSNPSDISDESIERLEEELNSKKDKYLRLVAEFDNYKRRTSREKLTLFKLPVKT
jgi:molecular chaperone GrpE